MEAKFFRINTKNIVGIMLFMVVFCHIISAQNDKRWAKDKLQDSVIFNIYNGIFSSIYDKRSHRKHMEIGQLYHSQKFVGAEVGPDTYFNEKINEENISSFLQYLSSKHSDLSSYIHVYEDIITPLCVKKSGFTHLEAGYLATICPKKMQLRKPVIQHLILLGSIRRKEENEVYVFVVDAYIWNKTMLKKKLYYQQVFLEGSQVRMGLKKSYIFWGCEGPFSE